MIRVITFNIRFDDYQNGENAWQYRRELVIQVIKRYSPSILGTQEGRWHQLVYLKEQLGEYAIHVPDRVIDDTCQYPTLFYCKKRFHVEEGGEFWLSKTPAVHLSKNWNSAFPRMMSYGLFLDQETGKRLWILVTHLDHKRGQARWEQAKIIGEFIRKHEGPAIVMGDFNDRPDSSVHDLLTREKFGLYDTWQVLGRKEDELSMTHHGFQGTPQKTRMDWIFVSRHFQVLDAHIIRDSSEGRYPSDHFPYRVDLEWR